MASDWLNRLQSRKLSMKAKHKGIHKGMRSSRATGLSFDFSDYRSYQLGDDIRQIDWNVYGRTEKLYIKRFLDEQEIFVSIVLDCSTSMQVIEKKWNLAKQIAASFSYMTLANDDRLNFLPVGITSELPLKRKGSLYSKQIYHYIMEIKKNDESVPFGIDAMKKINHHAHLVIIITDGMEELKVIEKLFKRIITKFKQVRMLQILSKEELSPEYASDLKLIDSEEHTSVQVSMSNRVIAMYKERLKKHNEQLASLCKQYGISYLQIDDEKDLHTILFSLCAKSGWIE